MAVYKRVCNFCQKDFIAQKYNTKTCSNRCANLSHKMKVRQDKQNLFNDNETYKRLLNKILLSVERIEMVLDLQGIKEQIHNQDLLTTEQYCEYMNIHPRTVRRMIERKEIEVTKHNNKIYINKNQIKNINNEKRK
jgi:excisionase family DNA binding protein